MIKNRIFTAFAFVGLLGLTACGGAEEAEMEQPVLEEQAPVMEPAPMPMTTDTAAMPMGTDTGAVMADTAAAL